MSRGLKKLGVKALLLVTKSFVYLQQQLQRGRGRFVGRALQKIGRGIIYAFLFAAAPLYGWYRRARRGVRRVFSGISSRWLRPFSHRYLLHGIIIALAVITVGANFTTPKAGAENFTTGQLVSDVIGVDEGLDLSGLPALPENAFATEPTPEDNSIDNPPRTYLSYDGNAVFQPYLPFTETSVAPRTKIQEYTIKDGDTPAGIAAKFQLRLSTILDANKLTSRSLIRPGQTLIILPIDGILYTVKAKETVGAIAKRYSVSEDAILLFNGINDPTSVTVGKEIIIPGGKAPAATPTYRRPTSTPQFGNIQPRATSDAGLTLLWPSVDHHINQYFTYRHAGLDIKGRIGVPIFAAEDGVVLESRWGGAYGNMTVIRHDNGLVTRYGHATKNLTVAGQRVTRGETIALMGSTGRSTGPHLHFEVISRGVRVNPLSYTR
ncbi:MAG: peptidoglycan DD-metalloendopeptidase family protein [Patescibacteria group bacterium]|jgi:LysM repeat protein